MTTARLPLNFDIASRKADTSKDARLVNAVIEGEEIVKRPGLLAVNVSPAIASGQGQGLFAWNNYLISVNNNVVTKIVGNVSTTITTLTGTPLPVSFSQSNLDTYLVLHNGTILVYIDKATGTLTNPLSGASVISATIDIPGGRYDSVPAVTFTSAGGAPQATGTAVLFNHTVGSITINTPGTYTVGLTPDITIAGATTGTAATCSGTYGGGGPTKVKLLSVSIISGSTGYIDPPIVTFPPSIINGQKATGYSVIDSSGTVTGIVVTYGGLYDTTSPANEDDVVPVIAAPPGATAKATANMNATISGPFAYGLVYLDGSFYVMNKTSGYIYGSTLNNPTSGGWNALNFIVAGSDSDVMVGIARHLNYIVAFGTIGTEFFYDAGNPGPGSPLDVNKSAYIKIGCANAYSIATAEQTVVWVGQSETEGKSVYLLSGIQPVKISNRYIDKYLNSFSINSSTTVRSYCLKISGHTLYILSMPDIQKTFVFDLDEKKWYQWSSQSGDTTGTNGTEDYFSATAFNGNLEYDSKIYLQDDDTGAIYTMSSDYYNDNGNKIYMRAVSPITDSGTTKRKFYQRVEVVGDKINGTGYIRHTSDDYQTWSTYRSVNLIDKRPILRQLGEARRRAWEVFISDNVPIRLKAIEMDFDIGEIGAGAE